ncbi:MAG: response regulator [Gammaproteobacteria bacterium]|jgi:DNA-binding response OmpR family regulator|nr:response regulator [Gammaproteobacteria bacterium]MBU0769942.1 response regulator [Gammaproteobacteria bacterium]MBU0856253.1 response regulator [Gammaproteobacteria bacterium]MBU1847794.1 response regulator [Gammaproteobacteria bacterium]
MQIGVDSQRAVENRRVFVVDNDEVVGMALQFMLADEMETHVLQGSAEALSKGAAAPPDVLLLGSGVLASEGVDVVTRLKAGLPGVKILLVCLDAAEDDVRAALALGADSTLLRPLKVENVRRRVDTQLGRRTPLEIPVVLR